MASLESIDKLLHDAANLLDDAAKEIRDAPLNPTKINIRRIGTALSEIFEIQHQIYALRPDLQPEILKGPLKNPGKAFQGALQRAQNYEQAGEPASAVAFLRQFMSHGNTEAYHEAALIEIKS